MKYRILGRSGLRVSVIGVGTWQFGGEWGKDYSAEEAAAVLGTARECGITLIDTAECYGDHRSEELIGAAIAGQRDEWILATKFGHRFHGHMDRSWECRPNQVRQQLEDSLRALRTDHVDLYQFHSGGDEDFLNQDLWDMLQRQVEAGRIRHLGHSVGRNDNLTQVDRCSELGAEAVQVVYNRLSRQPEEGLLDSCQRQNLGVLARVPLASGFLSGKYQPGASFPANDVRAGRDQAQLDRQLEEVARIQRDELPEGVPMARWALAWCLRHPAVTCVIPGCKDPDQVRANATAADLVTEGHPQNCA